MALVTTIHGEMDDSLLENKNGITPTADYDEHWNEYWLNGELVHRSVHLHMKYGIDASAEAAVFA